jgi:hypothetical protein
MSGFLSRGGFGLGRLIVSLGYGSDGRLQVTPIACLAGDTQSPNVMSGSVDNLFVTGLPYLSPSFGGALLSGPQLAGLVTGPQTVSGKPVIVATQGPVYGIVDVDGRVTTLALCGAVRGQPGLIGSVYSVAVTGTVNVGPVVSGRVLYCSRL